MLSPCELPLVRPPPSAVLGQGNAADAFPAGEPGQPFFLLLGAAPDRNREAGQDVAEKRSGSRVVPKGLGSHREIENLEPRAAIFLRDGEPHHAEFGEGLPEGRIMPRIPIKYRPQVGDRALVLHRLPNRVLQHQLLFCQIEIHRSGLLLAAASRGRPRPRSAITLR